MAGWVGEHMPYTLQTTRLFDDCLPADTGLSPLPNRDPSLLISEPEGALLGLAGDIGKRRAKGQSLEEAMSIAASLRNLRPKVLDTFLSHCTRVKVVKLVRDLGQASGFPWGQGSAAARRPAWPGRRWSSSRKDRPRFTLKA
ncbi:type IV toxin-antitoxin system AbiEi family antitoxin domain-containing protein [Paraburkholderia sp. LEh10]|uniref:type IV toxin-antitoxin system AbiEi family antitoxin domain-containing protein n=1 Tax=Paraburkholderia sp. LEh10 TaxID=2821353 RepID=UPI0028A63644|nr:type IV toxin-antitoxin system AbiEi family antitoxin domain-containing protein [Paraburkholderia sp. LEh10]